MHHQRSTCKSTLRLISKGRGQGSGADYQPWIRIQEFYSKGQRNRVLGWKTGRQHDYFSTLELYYHYILDWTQSVTDIQEQFPLLSYNLKLPLEDTILIARQCDINHLVDEKTKEFVPFTTDLLITIRQPIGVRKLARTIKPASELSKKRVIEKFEVERRFWKARGIDWGIVTENEINMILGENIEWIHPFRSLSALRPLTEQIVHKAAKTLTQMLSDGNCYPLNETALSCDDRLGLDPGSSLSIARHLIASKQWLVDMSKPIHPGKRLSLSGTSFINSHLRKASG